MTEEFEAYYRTLGLEPGADRAEVKRAYFRLIRKYPPEKEPEQFQKIRQAYEALQEERTEIEPPFPVPQQEEVRLFLQRAGKYAKLRQYTQAANCVKSALELLPDDPFLLLQLTQLQRAAGTPRKAAKTAMKLTEVAPEFATAYAIAAAEYYSTGWYKKALPIFQKAYALGARDLDFLMDYADAAEDNREIEEAKRLRRDLLDQTRWDRTNVDTAIYLYSRNAASASVGELSELLQSYLAFVEENRRIISDENEIFGPFYGVIARFQKRVFNLPLYSQADAAACAIAAQRPAWREELPEIRGALLLNTLDADPRFSESQWDTYAYTYVFPDETFARERSYMRLDAELCLIKEAQRFPQRAEQIRTDYPYLYEGEARKFVDTLISGDTERLFLKDKRRYEQMQNSFNPGQFYEQYPEERAMPEPVVAYQGDTPFVRQNAKPGRNDPCPCGSGKKFKRCCLGKGIYD